MRLRSKLVLGSLLLTLSLWPVAWFAETTSQRSLEGVLVERVPRRASDILDEVLRLGRDRVRELQVFVGQPALLEELAASNAEFSRLEDVESHIDEIDRQWRAAGPDELTADMQRLLGNRCATALLAYTSVLDTQHGYPVFGEIFITNRFGANVGQTGRTTDFRQNDESWWLEAVERGVFLGEVALDESAGVLSSVLCLRIDDERGELAGVLKAVLDVRGVTDVLDRRAGPDMQLVLLDGDGRVLHDTSPAVGSAGARPDIDLTAFDVSLPGTPGVRTRGSRSTGEHLEALASGPWGPDAQGSPWHLLIRVPTAGVLAPARELRDGILGFAALVTLLGSALGLVLSLNVARRVEALRTAAGRIRDGALDHRVEDPGRDELGELAGAFDEMGSALETARDELEAARDAREAFLTHMSHEIRTPMTAIVGATEVLLEPEISEEEQGNCFRAIRTGAEHLVALMGNILDLSKIDANRLEVEALDCSPVELAQDAVELLAQEASARGLDLSLRCDTGVPARIRSDPTRIRQVLVNLVGNALKFTRDGGVTISLSFETEGEPSLRYDVIDTGIGIDPDRFEAVFRPFEQAEASTTRRFGGTGIGLTLSRELARALGGELTVASSPSGSTFSFRIAATGATRELVDEVGEREATRSEPLPDVAGARVLLAEDVAVNRRLISATLAASAVEVVAVSNGAEAVDRIERDAGRAFDLVLMDLSMPELDGWEATRRLRDRGYRTPIVALTADATQRTADRCLESGFDAVVTKPVRRAALLEAIARSSSVGRSRRSA